MREPQDRAPVLRLFISFVGRHAFARQFVGAFVFRMPGVALDPVPVDLMRLQGACSSACHSSAFLTGFLSAVRQPLRSPAVESTW